VKKVNDLFRKLIGNKFTLGMKWTGAGDTVGSMILQIKIGKRDNGTFKNIKVGVKLEGNAGCESKGFLKDVNGDGTNVSRAEEFTRNDQKWGFGLNSWIKFRKKKIKDQVEYQGQPIREQEKLISTIRRLKEWDWEIKIRIFIKHRLKFVIQMGSYGENIKWFTWYIKLLKRWRKAKPEMLRDFVLNNTLPCQVEPGLELVPTEVVV
jgi:hypothetical protein